MPLIQEELEVKRLTNLVTAFGWKLSKQERTDTEIAITFTKPRSEPYPEDAVGAD